MLPNIHLLLDLTQSGSDPDSINNYVTGLMSPDVLGRFVRNAVVLVPEKTFLPGFVRCDSWSLIDTAVPLPEANAALEYAGDCQAHLLVLLEPVMVGNEAVSMLADGFALDPHFGACVPRQCHPLTGELFKLAADAGDPALTALPRRVLTEIANHYVLPEIVSPCLLVRDTLVANLPLLDSSYETLAAALRQYLTRGRRAGFRTVVMNRSVVTAASGNTASPFISKSDNRKLHIQYPDVGKAKAEFAEHSLHLHESLLGRAFSADLSVRKSLLLDIRGVPNHMNGTAEAIFGFCDGLKTRGTDWSITLLAEAASVEYHHLEERYALWRIVTKPDRQFFTAAFRPSQPWHISTMTELHEVALLNFYAMLDTISWDILFDAPRGLGAYWDFASQYADGLLYISQYTREHFARRFPSAQRRPGYVFHLPPDPVDESLLTHATAGDFIFVIGNSYDHKHLGATLDLLSAAFPFESFKVLGLRSHPNPRVEVLESGRIPQDEIDRLFAQARLIVFPSLYEGFGLPTLRGLSYGRTVIARESELLHEIVGQYRGPGRLHSYATPQELVDAIGKILHGVPIPAVALGITLANDEQPKTWPEVAGGVMAFIEEQARNPDGFQWTQRERVVRLLNACSS